MIGCGGHDDASLPHIDKAGTTKNISTLSAMVVDQLSFSFVKEEFDTFSPEIYVVDAETGKNILCADTTSSLSAVDTEVLIYGNLNAQLKNLTNNTDYSGKLFYVKMYLEDHDLCVVNDDDTYVGQTAVVNFDSLTNLPLVSTNGRFYVRLKSDSEQSTALPKTVSSDFFGDETLLLDQLYVSPEVTFGDNDNKPDLEVHILNADTDERLACSGKSEGLEAMTNEGLSYGRILGDVINSDRATFDFSSLSGTNVKLVLIDNDGSACPRPIATTNDDDTTDDVLGESTELLWDDLPGRKITFKNNADEEIGFVTYSTLAQ